MRRRIGIMVMVAGAAALLAGCGDDDDSSSPSVSDVVAESGSEGSDPGEGDGDVDVDLGAGEITIEDGEDSVTAGGALPDDFPDAVVLPDGYQILQAQERDYGGLRGWIVIGLVDDTTAAVRTDLLDKYGEPDEDLEQDGVVTLRWLDVGGDQAQFTLTPNADGDAGVSINVQER